MNNLENKKKISFELAIGIVLLLLGVSSSIVGYILKLPLKKGDPNWYIYLLYISGAILLFLGVCFGYRVYQENKPEAKKLNVRQMTLIAFQSAITIVLYYFAKFNLPFFPSWLDIQVSEIPALITSFIYGPSAGALVIFIRFLVKLPATITAGVGELADLVIGLVLIIVSGVIYKKHRTLKGALVSLAIGMVSGTVVASIMNWLVLIPAYVNIANFPMDRLVSGLNAIYPFEVTNDNFMSSYIFVGVIPFNLLRYVIVYALTFILYKRTHIIFDKISQEKPKLKAE